MNTKVIAPLIVILITFLATIFVVGTLISLYQGLRHYFFNFDRESFFQTIMDSSTWYGMWNRWTVATAAACGIWYFSNLLIF